MKNYLIIEQGNEKECRIIESVILNDRYSLEYYWKKSYRFFIMVKRRNTFTGFL